MTRALRILRVLFTHLIYAEKKRWSTTGTFWFGDVLTEHVTDNHSSLFRWLSIGGAGVPMSSKTLVKIMAQKDEGRKYKVKTVIAHTVLQFILPDLTDNHVRRQIDTRKTSYQYKKRIIINQRHHQCNNQYRYTEIPEMIRSYQLLRHPRK